ncbi:MAG: NAD kinase [Phycisphaerae bacterium]|nr:NAD kinase [Phycisphaerae bacterium]
MSLDTTKPRIVFVTRKSPLQGLIERHGTIGQARFYLKARGESVTYFEDMHERLEQGLSRVRSALPSDQRRTHVDRDQLDRFLFRGDDIVVAVGQDGLVANVAKYLHGQLVAGINPNPKHYDGVLCPHSPDVMPRLLEWLDRRSEAFRVQKRVMVAAEREEGQKLRALNEVFIGHRTHQSARYRLCVGGREERHSSSGVICATGTGGTGWAQSIRQQRRIETPPPGPEDPRLMWFVREPFPSVATATSLDFGVIGEHENLVLVSEMGDGGVVFADGIETDNLEFVSGQRVRIHLDPDPLALVMPTIRPSTAASQGSGHPALPPQKARA